MLLLLFMLQIFISNREAPHSTQDAIVANEGLGCNPLLTMVTFAGWGSTPYVLSSFFLPVNFPVFCFKHMHWIYNRTQDASYNKKGLVMRIPEPKHVIRDLGGDEPAFWLGGRSNYLFSKLAKRSVVATSLLSTFFRPVENTDCD